MTDDNEFNLTEAKEVISAVEAEERQWLHDESEHPYKLAPDRKKRGAVKFPAIIKCNTYIMRHYASDIAEEIRQRVYDGDLATQFGIPDFTEDCISLRDCRISPNMSFWWQNRFEFLADLEVYLEADVNTDEVEGLRTCTVYVTLAFCFEDRITYVLDGIQSERPDRAGLMLDDYLIPIMSYDEVEEASEQMLLRYLPNALFDRRCINAFQLAKAMGLRIESYRLYRMPKTRSLLFWTESVVQVAVSGDEEAPPIEVVVPGDTIVTNEYYIPVDSRDLYIMHECFHAEYHWLFYRLQGMHNNDLKTIKKKRKPRNQGREPKNPLPILEWEARHGSHAIQMPRSLVLPIFRDYADEEQQLVGHTGWALENVGRRVSEEWGIPKYLIRSRMLHLGMWPTQGSLNYIRENEEKGHYIRPFMFDRESCPNTSHTFVIDPLESLRLYEENKDYRARIDTGAYVYVDGHVCLNDPKYIVQMPYGPRMTEWANRHVDECCLRFENVYEVDDNYEFHLNCINSDEEYNRHYIDFVARGRDLTAKEAAEQQSEIIASLPTQPGEALKALMKLSGVTKEKLAECAMVSGGTVYKWRNEQYGFDPETAVRIIVSLHLPPWISEWFLQNCGVVLQFWGLHMVYRNIIACHYMDDMRDVNSLIEASGYIPKKDKDEAEPSRSKNK